MDPLTIITVTNGLIGLLETLVPKIGELVSKGEITPETQAALLARIQKLRSGEAFQGPEWAVGGNSPSTPT